MQAPLDVGSCSWHACGRTAKAEAHRAPRGEPLADRVLALTLADEPRAAPGAAAGPAALGGRAGRRAGLRRADARGRGATARGGGRRRTAACLAALLAAGAPSARVEPSGHTALHLACQGGHVACAAQLLAAFPGTSMRNGPGPHAPHGLPRDDARRRLARRGDGAAPAAPRRPIRSSSADGGRGRARERGAL